MPSVQSSTPLQTSVLFAASSDAAIGRMPFQSVPSTVSVAEANNNSRGNNQNRSAFGTSTPSAAAIRNAAITQYYDNQASSKSGGTGFSSLFLAQLFGQGDSQSGSLMQSFLGSFSPTQTIDYETMIAFSRVKYKPSNAFVPRADNTQQPIVQNTENPASPQRAQQVSAMQQAIREFQSANQGNEFINRLSQIQSNPVMSVVNQMYGNMKPQLKASSMPQSLIRSSQGASSYANTVERNTANLVADTKPQYRLEL
jgi:hypothetical protein